MGLELVVSDVRTEPGLFGLPNLSGPIEARFLRVDIEMTSLQGAVDAILQRVATSGVRVSRLVIRDHGNAEVIAFGDDYVTASSLAHYLPQLSRLRDAFEPSAVVHIQECNVGRNAQLLGQLSEVWGVPVAGGTGKDIPLYGLNGGEYVIRWPNGDTSHVLTRRALEWGDDPPERTPGEPPRLPDPEPTPQPPAVPPQVGVAPAPEPASPPVVKDDATDLAGKYPAGRIEPFHERAASATPLDDKVPHAQLRIDVPGSQHLADKDPASAQAPDRGPGPGDYTATRSKDVPDDPPTGAHVDTSAKMPGAAPGTVKDEEQHDGTSGRGDEAQVGEAVVRPVAGGSDPEASGPADDESGAAAKFPDTHLAPDPHVDHDAVGKFPDTHLSPDTSVDHDAAAKFPDTHLSTPAPAPPPDRAETAHEEVDT